MHLMEILKVVLEESIREVRNFASPENQRKSRKISKRKTRYRK